MHPETDNSQSSKARQLQCKFVMAEISPVYQNDKRYRPVINDNFKRNPATISRSTRTGNQRHVPMGNRTKRTYRNDKHGKRTRTQCSTVTQVIKPIPTTFHTRTERVT